MRGSIRRRLLVGVGLGVGLALVVSGVLVYVLAERALVAQFDDGLTAKVRALALLVEQDGDTVETDIAPNGPPGEYYELWDPGGGSLVRSSSLGAAHLARSRVAAGRSIAEVTLPDGRAGRQVVLAFAPRAEAEGEPAAARPLATLAFARATTDVEATVTRLGRILVGVGLAAVAMCLGVLAWLSRVGLRPMTVLATEIAGLDPERREARVALAGAPAELRPIVDRLNEMLGKVDAALGRERALTADVSHELRTPLAGLRATIELALDRDRPAERYRSALEECLAICTQTEGMVASLLSLAKLDAGQVPVAAERVEVDTLVRDVLATHATRAAERELAVATELTAVVAHTDPAKLASVLHNLVDNAISYADPRGTLHVAVAAGPTIRITNTGCTLAPDDVARVFDRFWRGDAARTAGTHAGLGLAICKTLVGVLGGTIDVEVRDHRFIATVVLPATSETSVDSSGGRA